MKGRCSSCATVGVGGAKLFVVVVAEVAQD